MAKSFSYSHIPSGNTQFDLFTDCEEVLTAFLEMLNKAQPGQLQLLAVNGSSGAGKTFLSAYINEDVCPSVGWLPVPLSFSVPRNSNFQSVLDQLEKGVCAPYSSRMAGSTQKQILPRLAIHAYRTQCKKYKEVFDQYRKSISINQGQTILGSIEGVHLTAQLNERFLQLRTDLLSALVELCGELTRPVCILVDDYERLSETDLELTTWVLTEVLTSLALHSPQKTVAVVCGRIFPSEATIESYTHKLELKKFQATDIATYLHRRHLLGVTNDNNTVGVDPELVEAFQAVTIGHPLCLDLACTYLETFEVTERTPSLLKSNQDSLDDGTHAGFWAAQVLNRLDEPYRSLLERGAALRTFDKMSLQALLPDGMNLTDAEYERFLLYPFCNRKVEAGQAREHSLHEMIRKALLESLNQRSPNTLIELQRLAYSYYETQQVPQPTEEDAARLERLYYAFQLPDLEEDTFKEWSDLAFTAIENGRVINATKLLNLIQNLRSEGWKLNGLKQQATFFMLRGKCLELEASWTEAIRAYEQGYFIYQRLNDQQKKSEMLNNVGNIYFEQGELDEALKNYKLAYDLFEEVGYQAGKAQMLNNVGNIYFEQGELDEALKNYKLAYDLFEEVGYQAGKAQVLNDIEGINIWDPPPTGISVPSILGLRWVSRIYKSEYEKQHYKQMKEFDHFKSISYEIKRQIRPRVAQSISQIQAFQAWRAVMSVVEEWCLYIALVVSMILALITGAIWFQSEGLLAKLVFLPIIALVIAFLYFLLTVFILYRRLYKLWSFGLFIASILMIWGLGTSNTIWIPQIIRDGPRVGLLCGIICISLYWITIMCTSFLSQHIERVKVRWYPEEEVTQTLCFMMAYAEKADLDQWQRASFKIQILYDLEWIAHTIENGLTRSLRSNEAETDAWLSTCARGIAADFRQLKQYLLLPKMGEREMFIQALAIRLVYAAKGRWGLFEQAEQTAIRTRGLRFQQTLRKLAIIALTILIVGLMLVNPFGFDATTRNSIITVVLGFGLAYVLSLLDPKSDRKGDQIPRPKGLGSGRKGNAAVK